MFQPGHNPGASVERWAGMGGPVAFPTSNFIARELGYGLSGGWRRDDPIHRFLGGWVECAAAVRARFAPEDTYRQRLDEMLGEIQDAGFDTIEMWSGHLNPQWATHRQVAVARELLDARAMRVVGFHGSLGDSVESAVRACQIAAALGADLLTGGGGPFLAARRATAVHVLGDNGIRLAIPNHADHPSPQHLLAEVGDGGGGLIGVNLDTGWWGTHGYDPVQAIDELASHLLHVQIKDVVAKNGHDPCRLDEGCVPITDCLRALQRHHYAGAYSLAYLAADTDPVEICRRDRDQLYLESGRSAVRDRN